jgi:hypothetical protein
VRRGALFLSLQSIIRRAAGLGTIARMFLRVSDFTTLLTLSFSIIDLQSFGLQYCVVNKRLTKISIRNLKGINQRMSMFLLLLSTWRHQFHGPRTIADAYTNWMAYCKIKFNLASRSCHTFINPGLRFYPAFHRA